MRRVARLAARTKLSNLLASAGDGSLLIGFKNNGLGFDAFKLKGTGSDMMMSSTKTSGLVGAYNIAGSTFGGGKILTGGYDGGRIGALWSSSDGVSYSLASQGDLGYSYSDLRFVDVAYGNGVFVGITDQNLIFYSADAVNWTRANTPLTSTIYGQRTVSICFGNGKFIAVGYDERVVSSTNGINWTYVTSLPLNIISYAGNKWFASGLKGSYSYQGQFHGGAGDWSNLPMKPAQVDESNVVYTSLGAYIKMFSNGSCQRSGTGTDWVTANNYGLRPATTKLVGKGAFLAYGTADGYIGYSTNGGANWTEQLTSPGKYYGSLILI